MKVEQVICAAGRSGYMHRDLMAIKAGARLDVRQPRLECGRYCHSVVLSRLTLAKGQELNLMEQAS